jgi:hypothetical protein
MDKRETQAAIQPVLDQIKKDAFVEGYQATNEEAMGLLVAKFFEWDGVPIMRTAEYALEDANFHTESGQLADMAERAESL